MSFFFNNSGSVQYAPGYVQRHRATITGGTQTIITDGIRQPELYVESTADVEAGHLVHWTGEPSMFLKSGDKLLDFGGDHGHEYALSKVQAPDGTHRVDIAGLVIETAATPNDTNYLHKSVHSRHPIKNNEHVLRISRPGTCALAWVLDDHENSLNGVYTQYANGIEDGTYVIRELGTEYFTIEEINPVLADVEAAVQLLTNRLDNLTNNE